MQPVEQDFLARSTAAEHAGQVAARRRTNRLRGLVAALSLLLVVASVAVVVATLSRQTAQAERDRADNGRADLWVTGKGVGGRRPDAPPREPPPDAVRRRHSAGRPLRHRPAP